MYHQNHYKIIGVDLSRQTNISIPQKINFTGKLEEDDGATMCFIAEKQQKTILNFSLDLLSDCNGTRTHNHLVRKRTLNHLVVVGSSPIAVT